MMISILTNPWEDIVPGSERLVNKQSRYELLWGVEKNGDYALYIPITNPRNLPKSNISIKHLEIRLYESSTPESYIWVII